MSRRSLWVGFVIVGVLYFLSYRSFYFKNHYPHHDYNVAVAGAQMVANSLGQGWLPLWGPQLNMGAPIWPDVELYPSYDPVSLLVTLGQYSSGKTIGDVFRLVIFLWHIIFSVGVFFLFRELGRKPWAAFLGFIIVLNSSLTLLNFRQADDYVVAYRYVPWIAYFAIRFFKNPTWIASVILGLVAGIGSAGYRSADLLILALFCAVFAWPLRKEITKVHVQRLSAGLALFVLWNLPTLVAGFYWLTHVSTARQTYNFGYRGGLVDLFGPLVRLYSNETLIYIGWGALIIASVQVFRTTKELSSRSLSYWPGGFLLGLACALTMFYVGVAELFVGTDGTVLFTRSFNNQLPYLMVLLAYFACWGTEELGARLFEKGVPKVSGVAWGVVACCAAVLFTELTRVSLYGVSLNRYRAPFMDLDVKIVRFLEPMSATHFGMFFLIVCCVVLLYYGLRQKNSRAAWMGIAGILFLDLSFVNKKLIRMGSYGEHYSNPGAVGPALNTPFPSVPPVRQAQFDFRKYKHFHKQGPVLFHDFVAFAVPQSSWFRHKDYEKALKTYRKDRFTKMAGVGQSPFLLTQQVMTSSNNFKELKRLPANVLDQVAITDEEVLIIGQRPGGTLAGDVKIVRYEPNRVVAKVRANDPAVFVFRDLFTENWVAKVDGHEVPLLRTNGIFKGVAVSRGEHEIEFIYRPKAYLAAFTLRWLGLLSGLGFLLIAWGRRRQS